MVSERRLKGIILAGSHNWGDSTFERLLPRPLLPVAQRPLISYSLRWLYESGIQDVTVCANSRLRSMRARLTADCPPGSRIDYYEDRTPRGPAGCVRDAAMFSDADTLVISDGTAIPAVSLDALLETHYRQNAAVTLVVHDEEARPNGAALTSPGGIYVFDRRVLDYIPVKGYYDVKEALIPRLYREGEMVTTYRAPGACARVLNAQSYLAVNHWMLERISELPAGLEGYSGFGDVVAHTTARLAMDARLVGPVLIGADAKVGAGATIVGPASIGAGCSIGEGALVSRSVLWTRCTVGSRATVDRCILADESLVSPDTHLSSEVLVTGPVGRFAPQAMGAWPAYEELVPPAPRGLAVS